MSGIDLHTHSRFSDGTDSPTELVQAARRAGLSVVALTDHDSFDGLSEARTEAARQQIRLIGGLELSAMLHGVSIHVLGYGCRTDEPALLQELARLREGRDGRLPRMCAQLRAAGVDISEAEVQQRAAGAVVGRPHVADVLVDKGYVVDRDEAFERWLDEGKPGYAVTYACDVERAIDVIHQAGGAAVIAHPWARYSHGVLTAEVLASLVTQHQLDGLEVDHLDHDDATRAELRDLARQWDVLATGSSDYHGTGKPRHHLGVCTTAPEVLERLLDVVGARGGVA